MGDRWNMTLLPEVCHNKMVPATSYRFDCQQSARSVYRGGRFGSTSSGYNLALMSLGILTLVLLTSLMTTVVVRSISRELPLKLMVPVT